VAGKAHFDRKLFEFLRELQDNNERRWFEANKQRYMHDVRDPMLQFIVAFAPRLARISPRFVADPRPHGGSMFRIYRDTRFSKDKSPYKIMAAAQFRHEEGKNVHAPGFYLHLEPGNVFAGAGLWHPDGPTLERVRRAIAGKPKEWKRMTAAPSLRSRVRFQGDALKRPPRGYDPEHPLIEDLKRKDFVAVAEFAERNACSADFMNDFVKFCRTCAKYMEFLTRAVGLRW
jgi:uncharacterized protein (TIGR02453 family)